MLIFIKTLKNYLNSDKTRGRVQKGTFAPFKELFGAYANALCTLCNVTLSLSLCNRQFDYFW